VRRARLARCLVCPIVLIVAASGCQALHSYRPVPILVKDADTKQPIAGAEVRISYPFTENARAPWCSSGITGSDGVARLRAAPVGDIGILVELETRGYLSERKDLPIATVQALQPAHWFEEVERRPAAIVFEMYAEPRPTVELIVPSGYRGMVQVRVQAQDNAPCAPGQRKFSYVVSEPAVALVTGPSILAHVLPPDFVARYAHGQILSRDPKNGEPGLWWMKSEGEAQYFLVGTRGEFDILCRSDDSSGAHGRHSSSVGKGAGRGRRKDSSTAGTP
jgi:hypothetical protein